MADNGLRQIVDALPFHQAMPVRVAGETTTTLVERIFTRLTAAQQQQVLDVRDAFAEAIRGRADATCVWLEAHGDTLVLAHEARRPVMREFAGVSVRYYDAVTRHVPYLKDLSAPKMNSAG